MQRAYIESPVQNEPSFLIIPSYVSEETFRWFQSSTSRVTTNWLFPAEASRHCGAETNHHFCVLPKLLIPIIKWLLFDTTKCGMTCYAATASCYSQWNPQFFLASHSQVFCLLISLFIVEIDYFKISGEQEKGILALLLGSSFSNPFWILLN